jgi:hypothetical protein
VINEPYMPWEIQYVPEKETVVVTTSGPVSDEDARALTSRAIALLKDAQATRVLGDFRGVQSGPSLAAVYWLVNEYAQLGVPRQTKIALLHSKARQAVELAQFYETVCCNRRYEARAFDSNEAAEAWLRSGETA